MSKAELVKEIKGFGKIYVDYAPFDEEIRNLNEVGIKHPISVKDASYMRLKGVSNDYTRTCHAPICYKNSPVIISRISPLVSDLNMVEQAVNFHKNNQYPIFGSSIYGQWEKIAKTDKNKKPEKRRAIILPERNDYRIHRDSEEAGFFWEDTRKDYFNRFVQGDNVPVWQIPIDEVDSKNGTIINFIGFGRPVNESVLGFRYGNLFSGSRAFGVLRSREATEPEKNFARPPYNQRELNTILRLVDNLKKGKFKVSDLEKQIEKVESFLDRLKR